MARVESHPKELNPLSFYHLETTYLWILSCMPQMVEKSRHHWQFTSAGVRALLKRRQMRLSYFILIVALTVGLVYFNAPINAQQIERVGITPTSAADGAEMYRAYCASCHGPNGKGDGPANPALKVPATDLTVLSKNHDGVYPANAVVVLLRNPGGGAHGSADMPVWGDVFRRSGEDQMHIHQRAYNLTRYLESIQQPCPVSTPASKAKEPARRVGRITDIQATFGGDMYRSYCSSCHGLDGRGSGPVASSLKTAPTDLTKLRDVNGKFPELMVYNTLATKSASAAHGNSDMPVWGDVFQAANEDPMISKVRIFNILRYIQSIQR
jgi:mono/diheme cytochrome c family protein